MTVAGYVVPISNSIVFNRITRASGFLHIAHVSNATSVWPHFRIENEIPQNFHPRSVIGKMIVELPSNLLHFRQPGVRDVREIVVLDMVTDVEENGIQGAVVTHGRLAFEEQVVLRNEMSSGWVKTKPPCRAQKQIHQRFASKDL